MPVLLDAVVEPVLDIADDDAVDMAVEACDVDDSADEVCDVADFVPPVEPAATLARTPGEEPPAPVPSRPSLQAASKPVMPVSAKTTQAFIA